MVKEICRIAASAAFNHVGSWYTDKYIKEIILRYDSLNCSKKDAGLIRLQLIEVRGLPVWENYISPVCGPDDSETGKN